MKILLAPSESKNSGGEAIFDLNSLFLPQINSARQEALSSYEEAINSNNYQELSKLFGIKKADEIEQIIKEFKSKRCLKAIKRYSGVAFDYLDYDSLDSSSKEYLHHNLIIFSNLFGVVKANDLIPNYKLKQGENIGSLNIEKLYKSALKEPLDSYLQSEDILDLRAKYYDKFYKPNKKYTTLKFLKDGKVVSHWAKAYRGMVLRQLALNKVESIEEFLKLDIKNLEILEIREAKNSQEIIYKIV